MYRDRKKGLYVVMGVSGCGKTTVGITLSKTLGIPFFDADDFHPRENVLKMEQGIPLQDEDRQPWLSRLAGLLSDHQQTGCVLACSALKESYREQLRSDGNSIQFIYLKGDYQTILNRMEQRDHFMPTALLRSQFDTLEEPEYALTLDIRKPISDLIDLIVSQI